MNINPLLAQFIPQDKIIRVAGPNRGLAVLWAMQHDVPDSAWRWLGDESLRRAMTKRGEYVVMVGLVTSTRVDAIKRAGFKPITPEGFRY